jgi:hypothetical protein
MIRLFFTAFQKNGWSIASRKFESVGDDGIQCGV